MHGGQHGGSYHPAATAQLPHACPQSWDARRSLLRRGGATRARESAQSGNKPPKTRLEARRGKSIMLCGPRMSPERVRVRTMREATCRSMRGLWDSARSRCDLKAATTIAQSAAKSTTHPTNAAHIAACTERAPRRTHKRMTTPAWNYHGAPAHENARCDCMASLGGHSGCYDRLPAHRSTW